MDMETLRSEIRRMRLEDIVSIDGKYAEEHYHLKQREDGKWEVFFFERGRKDTVDSCVCETQEEAADALIAMILRHYPERAKMKPPLLDRWRQRRAGR